MNMKAPKEERAKQYNEHTTAERAKITNEHISGERANIQNEHRLYKRPTPEDILAVRTLVRAREDFQSMRKKMDKEGKTANEA